MELVQGKFLPTNILMSMAVELKKVPSTPGVYKFFGNHEIIYIGKAKNLKKRVSSYFGNSFKDRKTSQIKLLTDNIETFTTKNEVEALLLEQMLIKENKPKFNILLRDDKTYPYIFFSLDHEYPGIYSKRTKQAVDSKFFGPFVSSEAVKKSIKEIQKIFQVRNCSDTTFINRTRPCIEFQMKRCSAPCVKKISKTDYFEDIASAKSYLSSSDNQTINKLTSAIEKASEKLQFEKAAEIRDRLRRLQLLREEQSVVTLARDVDIFSVHAENNYLGICIVVVRRGKIRGTKTHLVKQAHYDSLEEVYQSAVFNFYDNQSDIPKKIMSTDALKSKDLLSKVIQKKYKVKVNLTHTPDKSIRPIFNLCKINAKQVIQNHISKEDKYTFAFNELKNAMSLKDNIKKGKKKVGVIFNLDKHDKEGSHWVGLFINIKKSMIYYLDSYGEEIPGQINKFVNKIKKQANALNLKKFTLRENRRRHQFSDSECGMYSLYFIIYMLKNDNFGKFTKQRIKDDYMKKLRKMYFNH